jgi:hypothetical protein
MTRYVDSLFASAELRFIQDEGALNESLQLPSLSPLLTEEMSSEKIDASYDRVPHAPA